MSTTTAKARKVKPTPPAPEKPIEWARADPAALEQFDPATKTCTMNCGKHAHDPRSYKELKFMCDDCDCHAAPHELKGAPTMPMIKVDQPDLLTRARDNIADIAKVERSDQLFGLRMHSLGWIAALHVEGLISHAVEKQLAAELDATAAARRAELLAAER